MNGEFGGTMGPKRNSKKSAGPDALQAGSKLAACLSICFFFCICFCACSGTEVRETAYPDGVRKSRTVLLRGSGQSPVRHGVQISWYPDGGRESMESFVNGYRQGYAFRWHPDGKPESVEHFADGIRSGQAKYWDATGALVGCVNESGRDCLGDLAGGDASSQRIAARP